MAPGSIDVRPAEPRDAEAVAAIYNHGIAERQATFETRARAPERDRRLARGRPAVPRRRRRRRRHGPRLRARLARTPRAARTRAWGSTPSTSPRTPAGAASGSRSCDALADAAEQAGYYKLTSRVFTTNQASLQLHRAAGFTEVGIQRRHGRLDGEWKDTILVERLLGDAAR